MVCSKCLVLYSDRRDRITTKKAENFPRHCFLAGAETHACALYTFVKKRVELFAVTVATV